MLLSKLVLSASFITQHTKTATLRQICLPLLPAPSSHPVRYKWTPINSNLPKPKEPKEELKTQDEQQLSKPVSQAQIKNSNVEYHGIPPDQFSGETIWYPVYRFPHVQGLKMIYASKISLSIGTLSLCATRIYDFVIDPNIGFHLPGLMLSLSLFGLIIYGQIFRKLVVQIYTSDNAEFIRFCRFTFFGKRLDMVLPRDCVMSLSETNVSKTKSFLTIKNRPPENIDLSYDNHEFYNEDYKLSLAFGGIVDKRRFELALGNLATRKRP